MNESAIEKEKRSQQIRWSSLAARKPRWRKLKNISDAASQRNMKVSQGKRK